MPAMALLMSNHLIGNTSLPLKSLPCTACLPCCQFFMDLNDKKEHEKEEIRNVAQAASNVDWLCNKEDCPVDFAVRNHLASKIEYHSAPLLKHMQLNQDTTEGTVQHVIRGHLDYYTTDIKRNQSQRKNSSFIQNLFQCRMCTACPLECAVRQLLKTV